MKKYFIVDSIFIILCLFLSKQTCLAERNTVFAKSDEGNCNIIVKIKNMDDSTSLYMNSADYIYEFDSMHIADGIDTICFMLDDPIPVSLFINNDPETNFQFYLCEGNYELNIDCKNKTASVIGSLLNTEFKEKMFVHDSMFNKHNIMHAMLYSYNGMVRDSAFAVIKKYGSLCDSLSNIHINSFYDTHPNSFLTLENIYLELAYTFHPSFDTTLNNKQKLRNRFERLNKKLNRYKMYQECIDLFKKEYPKLPLIPPSLFPIKQDN